VKASLETAAGTEPVAPAPGIPRGLAELVDVLGPLHGLGDELAPLRALDSMRLVPLEASVSLGGLETAGDLRLTLGVSSRPEDPDGRGALRAVLDALAPGAPATVAEVALALAARGAPGRRFMRGVAIRARRGWELRARPAAWLGGDTIGERSARVAEALASVGLDAAARLHGQLASILASHPFSAAVPYGLGFDIDRHQIAGAKTYFSCESPEVALDHFHGPIAGLLGLEGRTVALEVLAAATGPGWRRARWLLEASFELPAAASVGARAKLYVPAQMLAPSEVDAHHAILRAAAELGLDAGPYESLVGAMRPRGLFAERPSSLMVGVSVRARGAPSLEAYVHM
jgi:hypothetical protein